MDFTRKYQVGKELYAFILHQGYQDGDKLPTIRELAKKFQVSTDTIQRAVKLLKDDGVIASKHGHGLYVKSLYANDMGNSRRIGLLFANRSAYLDKDPYPGSVIRALRERLGKAGYSLDPYEITRMDPFLFKETLGRLDLAGLIFFEVDIVYLIREIQELRLPTVSMDHDASRLGIPSVTYDNVLGGVEMTSHLLNLGHRHIILLRKALEQQLGNYEYSDSVIDERQEGYRIAMRLSKQSPRVEVIDRKGGMARTVSRLMQQEPTPTAIVCASDILAEMLVPELKRFGLHVPEDMSVTGFGGQKHSRESALELTSVRLDYEAMGQTTAAAMLTLMQGLCPDPLRRMLQPGLVIRESTASLQLGTEAAGEK